MTTLIQNSKIGKNTKIWNFTVVFNSTVGDNVNIGCLCEIGNATIGDNTRIGKGVFICDGVSIGNNCFISPHVCFTNDKNPSVNKVNQETFVPLKTIVEDGAIIGAGSIILPGIRIGEGAFIAAGSLVTKDVAPNTVWLVKRK